MEETQNTEKIIGYSVSKNQSPQGGLLGATQINSEWVKHELSICIRPANPIDVGRNEDGDVVWASLLVQTGTDSYPQHLRFLSSHTEITHEPLGNYTPFITQDTTESAEHVISLWQKLQRHRTKALFALGVASALVVVGYLLPVAGETIGDGNSEVPPTSEQLKPSEVPAQDPTEAAIDFVVNGDVSGVKLPAGLSVRDLSATIVSQSGEIVLVDVQAESESGLTTFATLLLQKAGSTWRIREVFDPR